MIDDTKITDMLDSMRKHLSQDAEQIYNLKLKIQKIVNDYNQIDKESYERKIAILKYQVDEYEKKLNSFLEKENEEKDIDNDEYSVNGRKLILGINNLSKKNEEAYYDALYYFDKRCPYCNSNLFSTNVRQKIEIDHFIPINKGGQDVPWNLLPVCTKCNRQKSDKSPSDYLTNEVYIKCKEYLSGVKERYFKESIEYYIETESIRKLIKENIDFIKNHINHTFIKQLTDLLFPDMTLDVMDFKKINAIAHYEPSTSSHRFISENFEIAIHGENQIKASDLYESYKKWATSNNQPIDTQTAFGRTMAKHG